MNRKKLFLALAAIALVLLAAGLLLFRYESGFFLPRYAKKLDLTGRELTASQYTAIQEAQPQCKIVWSVPFQGNRVASDSEALSLEDLQPEDAEALEWFPDLTELEITAPSDYSLLEEFARAHPDCQVHYPVTLGDESWANDCQVISVEAPQAEALSQFLGHMTELTDVHLSGKLPEAGELVALCQAFPEISFHWTVSLGDMTLKGDTQTLIYRGRPCPQADIAGVIEMLPNLTQADLTQCGFSAETMFSLCREFPQVTFQWDVPIGDSFFPWDATELDVSGIPFDSAQQIEELLPCFPYLERVVMCQCGLDNETMDALNRKYEDIRFVWSINIRSHQVRTDTTFFYPYTLNRKLHITNEEASLLRYCTDIICIDLGHNGDVTDCEWAAYMPKLRYLVIGETRISDLSPLSNCKELVYLEMFTVPVKDYSPLVECTALEDLNLGYTYGDPTPIAKMTWLKNLWWCGAPTYNPSGPTAAELLPEALPNTNVQIRMKHPTANNWRQLDNYFAMRDCMGMFYLT